MALDYTRGDESHYESAFTVTGDFPLGRYTVSRLYAKGSDGSVLDLSLPPDDALIVGSSVDVTADGNPRSWYLPTPTVRPGASFLVTARIEDTVGNIVGQPVVSFSDGQRDLFAFFNRTASGVYRATVPVSQYYPKGCTSSPASTLTMMRVTRSICIHRTPPLFIATSLCGGNSGTSRTGKGAFRAGGVKAEW